MENKYFVPNEGQIYKNRNGSSYRCTGNAEYADTVRQATAVDKGEHWATMLRVTDGWAVKVYGVHQFEDGTIEWNRSAGGLFQCDTLARCSEYCNEHDLDMMECFEYLDELRDSSQVNMMGAVPYLQGKFPVLDESKSGAQLVLQAWMDSFSDYRGSDA